MHFSTLQKNVLNFKILVLFVRFSCLETREKHESFTVLIFVLNLLFEAENVEVVSATWRQTRHATKQASGDFLLAVERKTKLSKLLLLVLDESSKVCIFAQSM